MNQSLHWVCTLIICLSFCFQLNAQRKCGADEYLADRIKNDVDFAKKFESFNKDKVDTQLLIPLACNADNTVTVPVAIHYNTPIDCTNKVCLLEAAEAQIAVLNESFSASNSDLDYYTSTLNGACSSAYPLNRAPTVDDGTCIQFCLARKNHPPGSGLLEGEPAITVDQATWPTAGSDWSGYLNIFVSNENEAGQGSGTLGISALPGSADGDGFWVKYTVFGGPNFTCTSGVAINSSNSFDLGRTAVHEAGHYFGLYHVFQGSNCDDDDSDPPGPIAVNDTPSQDSPHYGCPSISDCNDAPSSCSGAYDNFYSFMDYSNDDCMVMFTSDQSKVINHWGNFLTWKDSTIVCNGLITEEVNCDGPSCDDGVMNGTETGIDCGGTNCGPCNYVCGDIIEDSAGDDDYFNNENTIWTICATGANVVTVSFTEFEIEANGSNGCFDKLEVFDGNDTSASSFGIFCGNGISNAPGGGILSSTGLCLTLKFTSDLSVVDAGWNATISCAAAGTCDDGIQNGLETGIDCGGPCELCSEGCDFDFYDTGGAADTYSSGEEVASLFCPDNEDEKVIATFTWTDIEAATGNGNNNTGCWDMLKVYDGDDDTAELIGTYCGEESGDGTLPSNPENNLFVGKEISSTNDSGCLYFVFESDNSINETGWHADIDCALQTSVPVEYSDFYLHRMKKDVVLRWTTESEINNHGFYVQRATNNGVFEDIAFVKPSDQPSSSKSYQYTDLDLNSGIYNYRLKQEDFDGQFDLSIVLSVRIESHELGKLDAFPNPSTEIVTINFAPMQNEKINSIKVYTKLGVLLKHIDIESFDQINFDLEIIDFPKGVYVVSLQSSKRTYIKQLTKI